MTSEFPLVRVVSWQCARTDVVQIRRFMERSEGEIAPLPWSSKAVRWMKLWCFMTGDVGAMFSTKPNGLLKNPATFLRQVTRP